MQTHYYYLLLFYLVMSIITYMVYRYDKENAEFNGPSKVLLRPRIPETTLHWLAFLGGWPGGLIAQQHLRHKTIKQPFQQTFRLTMWANIALLAVSIGLV
jgi:uncharacterized membrane protein YsdA (DUF1294 family)